MGNLSDERSGHAHFVRTDLGTIPGDAQYPLAHAITAFYALTRLR